MADEGISPEILSFITEYIDSVVQLEVLLLMQHAPTREWTAADVARELRIETSGASSQLAELCTRKILSCSDQPPLVYRYTPPTPQIAAAVEKLSAAYEERRVSVINLIYSKPADKLKSFADAFRLRKDPDA